MHASTPSTSRRSLLAGLAAVGAAAPAVALALPAEDDAELAALVAEFDRVAAAEDAAEEQSEKAFGRYLEIRPEFPEAATKTEADRDMMLCSKVGDRYGEDDIARLSKPQRGPEVTTPFPGRPGEVIVRRPVCPEKTARAQAIVKALEDYREADEAALFMSGHDAAEKRADELLDRRKEIEARILAMPAKTMAGVMLKARVVAWCYAGELPEADDLASIGTMAERFAVALAVDLIRMTKGQADG